jgi:acetyl esterase/lipase
MLIMRKKIVYFTTILFLFAGKVNGQYCTTDSRYTEAPFFDSTQITITKDIKYGNALDFKGNQTQLLLDLYYPNLTIDTSPKRPFIMLIHGGGFSSGSKEFNDFKVLCVQFAMRGFVCASIDYRLGSDYSEYGLYQARYRAIQDGHAALRFIVDTADAFRIDTNWLFVGGGSAGAITALGMAYADQAELDSISLLYNPTSVRAELGNLYTSGNSLTHTYSIKGVFNNWGSAVKTEIDLDEMIPTISFHGEMDKVVPIDTNNNFANYALIGSRAMHSELTTNTICSQLYVDPKAGHGIRANSIYRVQKASHFFKNIFCENCNSAYIKLDSIK